MTAFDHTDILYLAKNLSVSQLRHEIHAAEVRASVAKAYRSTEYQASEDLFPWDYYADACRETIRTTQHREPKTRQAHGRIDTKAIKARNDIVTVIEQYTKLRKAGKNFKGCCPIHQEKHPSLTVYPDQQMFHCYGCNRGGDVIEFIMAVENVDFRQAVGVLNGTKRSQEENRRTPSQRRQ